MTVFKWSIFKNSNLTIFRCFIFNGNLRILLQGRDFVTPEDIKFVAPYVLQHRLILTAEAEMEGYSPVKVTQRLIDKVEVPK